MISLSPRRHDEGHWAFIQGKGPRFGGMLGKEKLYLIQDTRDCVGNCASWWRAGGKGYTCEIDEAGRYTKEQAESQNRCRDSDFPVPEELALKHAVRHVRVDLNCGTFRLGRKYRSNRKGK